MCVADLALYSLFWLGLVRQGSQKTKEQEAGILWLWTSRDMVLEGRFFYEFDMFKMFVFNEQFYHWQVQVCPILGGGTGAWNQKIQHCSVQSRRVQFSPVKFSSVQFSLVQFSSVPVSYTHLRAHET